MSGEAHIEAGRMVLEKQRLGALEHVAVTEVAALFKAGERTVREDAAKQRLEAAETEVALDAGLRAETEKRERCEAQDHARWNSEPVACAVEVLSWDYTESGKRRVIQRRGGHHYVLYQSKDAAGCWSTYAVELI
jgi:hypothetical protein